MVKNQRNPANKRAVRRGRREKRKRRVCMGRPIEAQYKTGKAGPVIVRV